MPSSTKILLIEDDETDFLVTKEKVLAVPGTKKYEIEWAKDTKEALYKIQYETYDLYLVDYLLGSENGLDLVTQSIENGCEGPFILLTSLDEPELYEKSAEIGFSDYLLKDEISPSLLKRTITHAIKRKQTEDALKTEKIFTSNLLEEIPYMIINVSKSGKILSTNPAVLQTTGCNEEELKGKNWKTLIEENEKEEFQYSITDNNLAGFTSKLTDRNDKSHIIQWNILNKNINPRHDSDLGFILSGKDITSEIEAETQARQKEKMEALGHLAGGVAHEINNLLQPILLAADIMKGDFKDNEKQAKNIERILRNATMAGDIVNDVLIFSRNDHKQNEYLNINAVLLDTIDMTIDMLSKDTEIKTKNISKKSEEQAYINSTDMLRVMSNLLINAAHAMDDKGTINICRETLTLGNDNAIPELQPGTYAKIDITDTGSGIPAEHLENIFTPFFTTKGIGQGTGLGLSIAYNTIKNWNGIIKVESQEGKGTTFSLYIPISAPLI